MLQILLMILKILGILLLVILGVILAVLLLVLFVPIRYRVDGSYDEKPCGGILVSWLLHFVTVRVNYDGSVKALVKVLWFRLFDKTVWPAEEAEITEETETGTLIEAVEPVEHVSVTVVDDTVNRSVDVKPVVNKPAAKDSVVKESVKSDSVMDKPAEPGVPPKNLAEKIVSLIQTSFEKIRGIYQQISGKVDAGQEKIEMVRTFLSDQENRNTIHLLWTQVKKLLRHILPRKISGYVRFGFDDPATTGQILTYVSPFYGLYAKTLELEPVFDEKVIKGELHVKGHIRIATLLWIVIRVFFNKNFRVLLKKVMAMGKK